MKLRKKLSLLTALVLVAALLIGCGGGDTNGGDVNGGGEENGGGDTIRIGINYELSGPVATYGQQSLDGIQLAIDEINDAGGVNGKQLELLINHNRSEETEAQAIATQLMTREGVVAVLGPATSGRFKATIPAANENGVPVISGSATADDVTYGPGGLQEFAFRICFKDADQAPAMANFAFDSLEAENAVVILDSSSDYGRGLAENFVSTFEARGGSIVAQEAYVAGDTDFNAVLTRVAGMDFDVIYCPGYYSEVGLIIRQARGMGIEAPFLGADGYNSPDLIELAGADALNEVYFTDHYSSLTGDAHVAQFIENFTARHGVEPSGFNALGYDMGYFVADAIARAASEDSRDVRDAMAATTNFVGVTGTISIDEQHNAIKGIVIIGLEDGEQAFAEPVAAGI